MRHSLRTNSSFWLFAAVQIALILSTVQGAQAERGTEVFVGPEFVSAPLDNHLFVLRDPTHEISLSDVVFGEAGTTMQQASGGIALGYIKDVLWVRFTLKRENNWPSSVFLNFKPSYLDQLDIYVPTISQPSTEQDFQLIRLGDHVSSANRQLHAPSLGTELELPNSNHVDIYMRIKTSSTMAIRGWVLSGPAMVRQAVQDSMLLGALEAFFIALALVHLFYWLYLRQRLFLSFSAFLISLALVFLFDSGLITDGPKVGALFASDFYLGLEMLAVQLTSYVFMIDQLEAKQRFPIIYRGLQSMIVLYAFLALFVIVGIGTALTNITLGVTGIWIVLLFACNLVLLMRKRIGSGFTSLAYIFLFVGFSLTAGRLTGLLPFSALTENAFLVGMVLFIFFMNLSLLQRARTADQHRREGLALRVARQSEEAAKQLVIARTAELQKAKEEAETALTQEKAAQLEQLRFVDVVTHQYQTPLSVIRSSVAAIIHTLKPDDDANRRRGSQIQAAISRLMEVLDVSLHRSRMDGSTAKAKRQEVDLVQTIKDIVCHSNELSPDRQIQLEFQSIHTSDKALLDPDMIGLALTNLTDNAVKFSPIGNPVIVRCHREGDHLLVQVIDTGIGIPEDEKENISTRYFRASNTGGIPGTGLGLHIVRSIATAHGGTFSIANCQPKGVIASLKIPALGPSSEDM